MSITRLDEDFERSDGTLVGYVYVDGSGVEQRRHYDIRAFHSSQITVPRTVLDMDYWNAWYFDGLTMDELSSKIVVEGRTQRRRVMNEVNALSGTSIEGMKMKELNYVILSLGNEEWPVDPAVTVGPVAAWRYQNALQVTLTSGQTKSVTSYYVDDILTGFEDPLPYYIELVLRDFPAQSNFARLDLAESYIDFSSDPFFASSVTDSIKFSDSLLSLTAGGDVIWRITRDMLTKADLRDLQGVRLRLKAIAPPPPSAPPTASAGPAGVLNDTFEYVMTYVTAYGETLPSPISSPIQVTNQQVTLSVAVGPTGVTNRKIYRRIHSAATTYPSGSTYPSGTTYPGGTGDFLLVATLDNVVTTHNDNYVTTGTEAQPPTTNSAGDFPFKCQALRMYREDYLFEEIDIDTKRAHLSRSIPRSGTPEHTADFPAVLLASGKPKNVRQIVKFNSGHHPSGNDNFFALYLRHGAGADDNIQVRLFSRDTQSRIRIYDQGGEVFSTPTNANALTAETDYFLVVDLDDGQIRAAIHSVNGIYLGAEVYSTGWQSVQTVRQGYVGFEFKPYNYDFTIDWFRNAKAEFATLESKAFPSTQPVVGATILPYTSNAIDLLAEAELLEDGDVTVTEPMVFGNPPPSYKLARTGLDWIGGQETPDRVTLGDPSRMIVQGDIYPVSSTKGRFRVVLIDRNGSVGFIGYIENLVSNKWNSFFLPIKIATVPAGFRFQIQNVGFAADNAAQSEFYVDNVKLCTPSIFWEASADSGANWQGFYHAVAKYYSGVNFATRGRNIRVRAIAATEGAWIQGYELLPRYAYPGHRPSS